MGETEMGWTLHQCEWPQMDYYKHKMADKGRKIGLKTKAASKKCHCGAAGNNVDKDSSSSAAFPAMCLGITVFVGGGGGVVFVCLFLLLLDFFVIFAAEALPPLDRPRDQDGGPLHSKKNSVWRA